LSEFRLERENGGGATVVVAGGDIDMTTSREFGRRLEGLLRASTGDVVLDLLQVVYLDSTALRALLASRKVAAERGSRLVLVVAQSDVLHVLEVTGLTTLFDIHATRAAALRAIGTADQPKR
jgi:anti-sigma B factor antagonist